MFLRVSMLSSLLSIHVIRGLVSLLMFSTIQRPNLNGIISWSWKKVINTEEFLELHREGLYCPEARERLDSRVANLRIKAASTCWARAETYTLSCRLDPHLKCINIRCVCRHIIPTSSINGLCTRRAVTIILVHYTYHAVVENGTGKLSTSPRTLCFLITRSHRGCGLGFHLNPPQLNRDAQRKLIRGELRKWYSVRDTAREKLYFLFQEATSRYHQSEWELIEQHAVDLAWRNGRSKKTRLERKLDHLQHQQKVPVPQDSSTKASPFYKKVENLTNEVFSFEEISLLEKGLKHNPYTSIGKSSLRDLAFTIDAAECPSVTKALCAEELKTVEPTPLGKEERTAIGLKKKFRQKEIVALKADKATILRNYKNETTKISIKNKKVDTVS
ncbi:unnamed protein product [Nesidiocoris tenuis]|uniref:Uncharacterized protein n=1 Tax=Nesidiocoris tenuis TaxID=355587 RepID=A0A6H5GPU4_9HEMI|nr:unnamed protein product [Nesidiocoris tenuis]